MAAREFRPRLYRYYDGVIYECRLHGSHGDKVETPYFVDGLPLSTNISDFAPTHESIPLVSAISAISTQEILYLQIQFWVKLDDLKNSKILYGSKKSCKDGMKRVFAEMLKDSNANKEYIYEQILKLEKIKTR